MDKKIISLAIFAVVVTSAILTVFFLPKPAQTPSKTSPPESGTTPTQIPEALCNPFPTVTGETSCQDAVDLVLQQYPGKVTKIDRKTLSIPVGEPPPPNPNSQQPPEIGNEIIKTNPPSYQLSAPELEEKMAWKISIILSKDFSFPQGTTKILDVVVSVSEKKILVTYPKFEK